MQRLHRNVNELSEGELKIRIVRLQQENIITEEERIFISRGQRPVVERKLFNLLLQKDMENCIRILEIIKRPVENNTESSSGNGESSCDDTDASHDTVMTRTFSKAKNPLMICGVLRCVFGFLRLKDIKKFRLVCREWDSVASPLLRKRSRISFGYPSNPSTFTKSYASFKETFKTTEIQIPFSAVELTRFTGNNAPWSESALKEFFESWKKDLKELWIDDLRVESYVRSFNISDLLIGINITKLNVAPVSSTDSKMIIALDHIPNIKYLTVNRCIVQMTDSNFRISPVEIDLLKCDFTLSDDHRILNDWVNFENTKSLKIIHTSNHKLFLDLSGNFELDYVKLQHVKILNWDVSNWKIEKLTFSEPYLSGGRPLGEISGNPSVYVKQMEIEHCYFPLSYIPLSVERLTIISEPYWSRYDTANHSENLSLPKLKHLVLPAQTLRHTNLSGCTKLESMKILSCYNGEILLRSIPESVKNLKFDSETAKVVGEGTRPLDRLILTRFSSAATNEILNTFQPKHVTMTSNLFSCQRNNFIHSEQQMRFLTGSYYTSVALGPLKWVSQLGTFETSIFSKLVKTKDEYYLFQRSGGNLIGEGIDKRRFYELMEL